MATKTNNRCSQIHSTGFQGKHELVTPYVRTSHSTGRVFVEVDPADSVFYARAILAFTADTGTSGSIWVTIAGNVARVYGNFVAGETYVVTCDIVGAENNLVVATIYAVGDSFSGSTHSTGGAERMVFNYTHTPGSPFEVSLDDNTSFVIDNTAPKRGIAIGG